MATSSQFNRGYAELAGSAGSLANRPTKFAGGVRRRDEPPEAFRDRMDAGRASNGVQPPPMLSRRDNIIAARADDSFRAKVDAYNQAGAATGHSMDDAGNLIPPAQVPPRPVSPPVPNRPGSVLPPTIKRPTPMQAPGKINGQPAAQAIAAVKTPQTQIPMAAAQKPVGGPAFQMPAMPAAPTVTPPTGRQPVAVTPPTGQASPGGMMPMASRIAQAMNTAMTSTHPSAVIPRAQAITQTRQKPVSPPALPTLWPAHTAAKAVAADKAASMPQPISNAGLGVQPPPFKLKPAAAILAARG